MQAPKLNKSCDQCRRRKVRCILPPDLERRPAACTHCIKRNETCQFSSLKRRLRSKEPSTPQASLNTSRASADLFIDRLIANPSESAVLYDEFSVLKVHDDRVPSSGIAFFSAKRVDSLVKRLGDTRLRHLVHQIDKTIRTRLLARPERDMSLHSFMRMNTELEIHPEAPSYIKRFFEVVHPVYPFIDRKTFEDRIALPKRDVLQTLNSDHQFCGLYYAVLALGAQYSGSGSFIPDNNGAWKFFQTALSCLDYILMSTDCIENLQAITAMAVFSTIAFGHSLDQTLVAEASRMVIALRYHKSALGEGQSLRHRIFWVIYHLEKRYCFQARQSSSIADYDIGCPISPSPDSLIGEYDWLLSSVRFSRILSIAYASLFSVTASTQSNSTLLASIDSVQTLLEEWRTSVPVEFRPKEPLQRQRVNDAAAKEIALRTHYYYYHIVIALSRLTLHVSHDVARSENAMRTLLDTARSVINLTRYIDVEPYTPTFILAILPLSALFILFDFVIHHPTDSDIHGYLTLLDIVAGHFSQLDYASNGAIPSSHLSEFSHMARGYVQRVKGNTVVGSGGGDTSDAEPDMGIREGMAGLSRGESAGPSTGAEASTTAPIPDPSLPTLPMRESNDQTLMEGIDYTSLDNLYFLTPDCDFWTAGRSFEEFDPREFYGEIFQ